MEQNIDASQMHSGIEYGHREGELSGKLVSNKEFVHMAPVAQPGE